MNIYQPTSIVEWDVFFFLAQLLYTSILEALPLVSILGFISWLCQNERNLCPMSQVLNLLDWIDR